MVLQNTVQSFLENFKAQRFGMGFFGPGMFFLGFDFSPI